MPKTMTAIDEFAVKLANFVIAKRWLIILATLMITVGVASGARFLTFSNNYRDFFSEFNPELQAFEDFQNTYTKNDNFFFTIVPKEGDVFNADTLALVEELTNEAWQIPFSIRVDSPSNFQHTYAEEDDLIVEDLVKGAESLNADELAEKSQIALTEPLMRNQLVTADARAIAVNVVVQYPQADPFEVPQAVAFARDLRDRMIEAHPDHEIRMTGVSMLNNAFQEAGFADTTEMIPLMYLLLLVLMAVTVRSISGTVVTLLMIAFASVIGMGAAGFAGIGLTPIALSAPTIILTLAIADAVHILITMRNSMAAGMTKREALVEAVRVNFLAVMVTSLTTAIGFLALNFSDAPPFWHLGNIAAVGIVVAWAMSVTFLPAMMSILPVRAPKPRIETGESFMGKLADFVVKYNKPLFYGLGGAALLLIAAMPRIEFNDQWTEYFDPSIQFRQDADYSNQYFGFYPIEFSVQSPGPGGVSEPEFLEKLDEFTAFLREQPNVTHVYSLTDIMKRLNRNMHADEASWYKLPDDRELSAQYLLLYELSLPYGLDLNDRVNIDKSATRVTVTLSNISTTETKTFLNAARGWIADNAPDYMKTTVPTSAQVMFTYVAERNVASMITGNIVAIVAIGIVMMIALKSFKIGALSMVPNTLPILSAFGAWALLVGTVGFSVAAVASVSLGIVVDDTVHFLAKYVRGIREKGYDRAGAIKYAFETVGYALVVNTVVLVIGFAYLATSHFKMNADLGLLTALAITFALIFDFLFLPALMLRGSGKWIADTKNDHTTGDKNDAQTQAAQ
ncbi:efflux RND transporter permease subunit [Kordiimonas gwangyangensis]|uniref:efflux RND transporter permease subunit n=1 Tax=Kordiimonas gwangyangensis TaxID=288022 RepID=UPI0003651235|nr:MMPL family transporter [Kordiimonas gwangyangensis]